jgi:predicted SAM-dependent methyltransferase
LFTSIVVRVIPRPRRVPIRRLATLVVSPLARVRASRWLRKGVTRVHLGSGYEYKPGWLNVDLVGGRADVVWDLCRPLPFRSGTVDAIFHEHVLEHLSAREGFELLQECHRVLKPGGVLRIGVPDAARYVRWYTDGSCPRDNRPTPLLALVEQFYGFGHRMMYDAETLEAFVGAAGFPLVEEMRFGQSRLDPVPDTSFREWDTLYIEAVKES